MDTSPPQLPGEPAHVPLFFADFPRRFPFVESRTSTATRCHHLRRPLCRFARLSRDERPKGSLPAFAWGDVAPRLNPYPPCYRAAFAFSLFLYPHRCRRTLRLAYPEGRRYGLTTFRFKERTG